MITGVGVGVGVARRLPFFFGIWVWPLFAGGPTTFPVEGGIVRKIDGGVGVGVFSGPFGGRVGRILGVGVTVGLLEVPGGGVGVRVGKFRGVNIGLGKGFTPIGPVGVGAGGGVGVIIPVKRGGGEAPPRCFFIAVRMRSSLGSGGKSVRSGCVFLIWSRSTSSGAGNFIASPCTFNICPARTFLNSLGYLTKRSRASPSSTIKLTLPIRVDSMITVVPVMPTVTARVLNSAPPEFLGTRKRIEPLSSTPLRPAF